MRLEDFKLFVPGVSMGIVRAAISHPFEIMKLRSQMNHPDQSAHFYKNIFIIPLGPILSKEEFNLDFTKNSN